MSGGPAYLVCTGCAHYWLAGEPPADSRCEHCRQVVVFWELATLAEAEERSQRILDRRASQGPAPLHGGPAGRLQ